MAQLVRAPPCHGGGHGFESRLGRFSNCSTITVWDLSSAGRASALQAEGHRFEPYWSHFVIIVCHDSQVLESRNVTRCFASMHTTPSELARFILYAAVAELADAQDLKSCGTYTPVPVRFRSAALVKNGRNVEFTAFLLFFCFKKFEHL